MGAKVMLALAVAFGVVNCLVIAAVIFRPYPSDPLALVLAVAGLVIAIVIGLSARAEMRRRAAAGSRRAG